MKTNKLVFTLVISLLLFCVVQFDTYAQQNKALNKQLENLTERLRDYEHEFNALSRQIDDVMWLKWMENVAIVDKVRMVGPPKSEQQTPNPTAQGAGNKFKFVSYVFIPKDYKPEKKYPLLVFPHGGVHSNFTTFYQHIMRELIAQGYIVVAPEYRGSTGYGEGTYKAIDYGGLEIEDTFAARNYMLENYDNIVDEERIGILGWSHGGLHTLMNIFRHPKAYKVAYAGVPVSDIVARMGYKTQGYRDLYSADYHIGKTAYQDVDEYMRRSPAWNAEKLETPLLIHTTTNDADVNVLEVKHLIKSLQAADKDFEYKIYDNAPGGHTFNRLDTKMAKESRLEIYEFMNEYLSPPQPLKSLEQMMKVSYKLK